MNDHEKVLRELRGRCEIDLRMAQGLAEEAKPRARIAALDYALAAIGERGGPVDLLRRCRPYIERQAEESGYGYWRPANPHDFSPDRESCTDEEVAAHKAACEAYDRGEYTPEKGDGWVGPDLHILRAPWGIGSYVWRDPEATALLAAIDALPTPPTQGAQPNEEKGNG